jgi:SHO1 osmosensor
MARFSASNIMGDPFALATVSISIVRETRSIALASTDQNECWQSFSSLHGLSPLLVQSSPMFRRISPTMSGGQSPTWFALSLVSLLLWVPILAWFMAMRYALTIISHSYTWLLTIYQISAYLSAGLVFTTLAVNSLVYQPQSSKQAAAAGFILLSMIIVSTVCLCYWNAY